MIFSKFSRFMGILLGNLSGFMGGTFTISMAQPRILETQVNPPPPGQFMDAYNMVSSKTLSLFWFVI